MTLTINDTTMTSDQTAHIASLASGSPHLWEVSWLPGRALDRNSAITAMVLADHAGERDLNERHRLWPFIENWAACPATPQVRRSPATTSPRPPAGSARTRRADGWPTPSMRPPA